MRLLTIVLLFGLVTAQSSAPALSGLGDRIFVNDAAGAGLGDSRYFSGRTDEVSFSSVSSLWRSPLVRFSMSTTAGWMKTQDLPQTSYQHLNLMSLQFPVGPNRAVAVGISPVTRTNYYLIEPLGSNPLVAFGDDYYTSVSRYHGEGGISEMSLAYSSKMNDNLSWGVRWNVEFGVRELTDTVYTFWAFTDATTGEIDYATSPTSAAGYFNRTRFSGNTLEFEGRWQRDNQEWVASLAYRPDLTAKSELAFSTFNEENPRRYEGDACVQHLGLGYLRKISQGQGFLAELHLDEAVNIDPLVLLFERQDGVNLGLNTGYYYRYDNSRLSFWNTITARAGMYYSRQFPGASTIDDFIDKPDQPFEYDMGVTLGLGLEYIKRNHYLDLSLRFGQRSSALSDYDREQYTDLVLSISTGEMWFIKRKRK